jgi:hypothetical protein
MVVPVGDSTPLVLRLLEVKGHFLLQGLLRELVLWEQQLGTPLGEHAKQEPRASEISS